jgi:hypothetical protein
LHVGEVMESLVDPIEARQVSLCDPRLGELLLATTYLALMVDDRGVVQEVWGVRLRMRQAFVVEVRVWTGRLSHIKLQLVNMLVRIERDLPRWHIRYKSLLKLSQGSTILWIIRWLLLLLF